jgi:hypothetical protein
MAGDGWHYVVPYTSSSVTLCHDREGTVAKLAVHAPPTAATAGQKGALTQQCQQAKLYIKQYMWHIEANTHDVQRHQQSPELQTKQ